MSSSKQPQPPPLRPMTSHEGGSMVETGVYRYETDRRSHEFFSPGPRSTDRTATASSAIFNLVSTIIGGGILSLPYAFDKCGLVLAVVFMVIAALASNFSLYVIVSCSRRGAATSYEQVVRKALGPRAGMVTTVLLVMLTFLTLVAYVILTKDLVGSLGEQFLYERKITTGENNVLAIICVTAVSPMLFARSMDALRFTSVTSFLSVIVLATTISARAVQSLQGHNEDIDDISSASSAVAALLSAVQDTPIKWFPSSWSDPLYGFPIISISFLCHFNVLPVYRELHKPTRHRLKKIVSITMFSAWVLYMIVGFMGYFFAYQLPGGVKDDILNNFNGNDKLMNVGRIGLLMTLQLCLPLIIQPCRTNTVLLGSQIYGFFKSLAVKDGEDIGLLTRTPIGEFTRRPTVSATVTHILLTTAIMACAVALALVSPGVAVVWNIMGSTVGLLISYVLPCASYVSIRKSKPHTDARKLTAWIILAISSVVCLVCTMQSFASVFS